MIGWTTIAWSALAHYLIVMTLAPLVLSRRKDPAVTIAWIFSILLMPFVGALAYVFLGDSRLLRVWHRRNLKQRVKRSGLPESIRDASRPVDERGQLQLFRLLERINAYPPVAGNEVELLTDMRLNYEEQLEAIEQAQQHIHVEYYIFQPDSIGHRFSEALIAAARRGVAVRFLYDAVGSLFLKRSMLREMRAAGIETAAFLPLTPLTRRWIFNFRNHRKIVVVDGEIGFIGGANIGEEYLGGGAVGDWNDAHLRLKGPVVHQLQQVFLEDWAFASGLEPSGADFFPPVRAAEGIVAQVVPGGPHLLGPPFHELYFSAVVNSVERVRITTPYFVPSESVLTALVSAARRGVIVEILIPGHNTKRMLQLASQAYYQDLLDAGVRLYRFNPGFVHAKILTVDGRWSVVGTANFDNRSMKLNFEIGVVFYDIATTSRVDRIIDGNMRMSQRLDVEEWRARPWPHRLVENAAALFSPIL